MPYCITDEQTVRLPPTESTCAVFLTLALSGGNHGNVLSSHRNGPSLKGNPSKYCLGNDNTTSRGPWSEPTLLLILHSPVYQTGQFNVYKPTILVSA